MGTIRLKSKRQEGKDYTKAESVIDGEGYTWNFGENQTQVLPDTCNNTTLASNATVKWGTSTQQAQAPSVIADVDDIQGRS